MACEEPQLAPATRFGWWGFVKAALRAFFARSITAKSSEVASDWSANLDRWRNVPSATRRRNDDLEEPITSAPRCRSASGRPLKTLEGLALAGLLLSGFEFELGHDCASWLFT